MKGSLILMSCLFTFITSIYVTKKTKVIKITVGPKEAVICVNNTLAGYGYTEFTHPKRKSDIVTIHHECNEYKPILTKYHGEDKRNSLSSSLQQGGFFRTSAASGIVNKFFTIDIDPTCHKIEEDKVDVSATWRLLYQILLNYFEETATTDLYDGYLQTPWQYRASTLSEKQIRNRVTVGGMSTSKRVAFRIKAAPEVAGDNAARHGEFTRADRIPKELEPIIKELQTRTGKIGSL